MQVQQQMERAQLRAQAVLVRPERKVQGYRLLAVLALLVGAAALALPPQTLETVAVVLWLAVGAPVVAGLLGCLVAGSSGRALGFLRDSLAARWRAMPRSGRSSCQYRHPLSPRRACDRPSLE